MIRKLSAVLVTGAVLFWGHALPAGAQEISVESPVAVDSLDPTDEMILEQAFQEVIAESADARREAAQAQKNCKEIKNKKKRKKCMKKQKSEGPQRVERTVEFEYVCPCTGRLQLGSLTGGDPNLGGGPLATGADDVYLMGTVDDASGTAVSVNVNQDVDGDGLNDSVGSFCGETEEPMEINPGLEMRMFIGDPAPCPGSVALGGTITFTLSNLP